MRFVFLDVVFWADKDIRTALNNLKGIGVSRSCYICALFGWILPFKIDYFEDNYKYIFKYSFKTMCNLVRQYYFVGKNFNRKYSADLRRIIESKSYKGMRLEYGLPVRGQRTHSNAGTRKRFRSFRTISVRGQRTHSNAEISKKFKKFRSR